MAGMSKRFYDAGYSSPKGLIDIFGSSMLSHITRNLQSFSEILIIASSEDVEKFELDKRPELSKENINVVGIESHTKGPSYSILMAEKFINPTIPTLVHYCDIYALWDIDKTFSSLKTKDAVFLSFKGFHPSRLNGTTYAYAKVHENAPEKVSDILEKKSFTQNVELEHASTGIYGFRN
jgi:NDP-sugar pyrophosphorylase family protein